MEEPRVGGNEGWEDKEDELEGEGVGEAMEVWWTCADTFSKVEFHWKLMKSLPAGAEVDGGREADLDGTVNYYALINLRSGMPAEWHLVDGDTANMRKEKRKVGESARVFDDRFGSERLRSGKYMSVWGSGKTGEYVYVVAVGADRTGEKGIWSGTTVMKPRCYRSWLEGTDDGRFGQRWETMRVSEVDGWTGGIEENEGGRKGGGEEKEPRAS